ncbi:CAAX protease self-immunity [Mucilaginibacter mallensis]|uniref:CAAX protease self-immunity n=1 Tax=Mucilaginibacter mallensis TaxID=652787 RepID=A0A1H1YVP9_MUCMA|nr:CPBP family glutamic-type intramembrane protease [Mucilaginibacter mallensis]SDT25478.1 CAAX protease self-immunity [Mucilaginibacter mallensis]
MEETINKFAEEILDFKNYPNLIVFQNKKIREKLVLLFMTYFFIFLLIVLSGLIILGTDFIVSNVLHFKNIHNQDTTQLKVEFTKFGLVKGALVMGLLGPLIEETIFRLPLSLNKYHIAIALSLAMLFFSGKIYTLQYIDWAFATRLLIAIALFLIIVKWMPANLSQVDNKYKTFINISSIALFGLVHITNYSPIQWPIFFLYPIYVLPQICLGWGLTYIRFRNGFFWGLLLHCFLNIISYVVTFL